jgi:hypothetical protein
MRRPLAFAERTDTALLRDERVNFNHLLLASAVMVLLRRGWHSGQERTMR